MGVKLLWTGFAIALLIPPVVAVPAAEEVGAVIALIGLILMWMDK